MGSIRKRRSNKEATRENVLRVAETAFGQRGIKSVRMDDLAAELSVSKRTLYELFGDKEELLMEVVMIHRKKMNAYMAHVVANADNVLEVLLAFYIKTTEDFQNLNPLFFEDLKKYPRVVQFEKGNQEENMESAMAFYQKGVEQGLFRDDVNFRIVQKMIQGQLDTLIQSEIGQEYSLVEIFKTLIFMHMRGISTEKGLKIVNDFLKQKEQR